MYHSSPTGKFAQSHPKFTCPNQLWHILESLRKGYEVRCHEARCCFPGNAVWADRHARCVARLLWEHVGEIPMYRGHLPMPDNATPADHVRTRKECLRILARWKAGRGCKLELHGVLDIDNERNAHWDISGYSDAPFKPLAAAVKEAWSRAGGATASFRPYHESDIVAVAKYQAKDTLRPDRARRYLPLSQGEMGMNIVWSTDKFWAVSEGTIWAELRQEYLAGLGSGPMVDRDFRAIMVARLRALTPDAEGMLRGLETLAVRQ